MYQNFKHLMTCPPYHSEGDVLYPDCMFPLEVVVIHKRSYDAYDVICVCKHCNVRCILLVGFDEEDTVPQAIKINARQYFYIKNGRKKPKS